MQKLKKKHDSGTTTLIISNEETNDIMKIVKNETKEQKGGFLSILLGTLGASLLEHLLTGKGVVRAGTRNKKGKGIVRAGT